MARTTEALVKGILLKDYDDVRNPSLDPFIDAASTLVDGVYASAVRKSIPMTDGQLEIIERWVSAHAYCMNDPQYVHKETGRAKGWFMGDPNTRGLEGSRYGQFALTLDPTGYLYSLMKGQPKLLWLGQYPSEQTPVEDKQ